MECMVLKSHASKANIARHHMSLEIKRRVALEKSILFKEFEFPAFLCITKPLKIEKNHNKTVKNLITPPTFSSSIATTSSPTLSFYRFTLAGSTCFLMKSWGLVLSALLWETVLTDAKMLRFQLWILLQLDLLTLSMLVLSGRLWQARVTDCLMPRNGKSAAKLSKRTAPHPLSDRSWTCKL